MPPRRHALSRLRVPDLDGLVNASTSYFSAVCSPCDGHDPAVSDGMSQYTKQFRQGKKNRWKNIYITDLSARSASSRTCPSLRSRSSQCGPDFHLLLMRRLASRTPSRRCVCHEMSKHTKPLRPGKKIRRQKKKKTHQSECPLNVDFMSPVRGS